MILLTSLKPHNDLNEDWDNWCWRVLMNCFNLIHVILHCWLTQRWSSLAAVWPTAKNGCKTFFNRPIKSLTAEQSREGKPRLLVQQHTINAHHPTHELRRKIKHELTNVDVATRAKNILIRYHSNWLTNVLLFHVNNSGLGFRQFYSSEAWFFIPSLVLSRLHSSYDDLRMLLGIMSPTDISLLNGCAIRRMGRNDNKYCITWCGSFTRFS